MSFMSYFILRFSLYFPFFHLGGGLQIGKKKKKAANNKKKEVK